LTKTDVQPIRNFILDEWEKQVPDSVMAAAGAIAGLYKGHCVGVLFYGSCLRTGEIVDKVLDFYVIVDGYRNAYGKKLPAIANKVLPPNVYYHEMEFEEITLRSKYAVLSLSDYQFRVSDRCLNVSVWARFCQPAKLLLARDDDTKNQLASDTATAILTMLRATEPRCQTPSVSEAIWVTAFENTYASELRAEQAGKGKEIYDLDQRRYDEVFPLALPHLECSRSGQHSKPPDLSSLQGARFKWFLRRANGKFVSFMRLIKAVFTFQGGIDYIAWKISRHSGVEIEVTDKMRKHPILHGLPKFWALKRKGAFK